jgi:hypothetical protein
MRNPPSVAPGPPLRAVPGWYLFPAMHHYRCYHVSARQSCAERITDTLTWLPHNLHMPILSSDERLVQAAQDLTAAHLAPPSETSVLTQLPDSAKTAIHTLSTISILLRLCQSILLLRFLHHMLPYHLRFHLFNHQSMHHLYLRRCRTTCQL